MKGKWFIGLFFVLASCLENDIGITTTERWLKDIAAIDAYLDAHGITAEVEDANSGIRINITELGTDGLPPNKSNDLKINYVGKLLSDGSVFDPGVNPYYGKLTGNASGSIIQGWQRGLPLLPAGTKATLFIPSVYGYGTSGSGTIPANANLIFDIDLESVVVTNSQKSKFTTDTTAIRTFLTNNSIVATKYDSGLWYSLVQQGGAGATAQSIYSQVRISYAIKEMAVGGATYYSNSNVGPAVDFSSRLVNFPHAVMLALQVLKEGEKGIFYAPSMLGWGPQGFNGPTITIPANANLIFEIELLEVIN